MKFGSVMHIGPPTGMDTSGSRNFELLKIQIAGRGTPSEWFRVKKGVLHGGVLSPYLFNILAETMMRISMWTTN